MLLNFQKLWRRFLAMPRWKQSFLALRLLLGLIIFIAGCYSMFWMRSHILGETTAAFVVYFLGAFFIFIPALAVLGKPFYYEQTALMLCIAAVIVTGLWFNFEEKAIMPFVVRDCSADCIIIYERILDFDDLTLVYSPNKGWGFQD
jgi:hypothetical protein